MFSPPTTPPCPSKSDGRHDARQRRIDLAMARTPKDASHWFAICLRHRAAVYLVSTGTAANSILYNIGAALGNDFLHQAVPYQRRRM
jgi:hypothetical protein